MAAYSDSDRSSSIDGETTPQGRLAGKAFPLGGRKCSGGKWAKRSSGQSGMSEKRDSIGSHGASRAYATQRPLPPQQQQQRQANKGEKLVGKRTVGRPPSPADQPPDKKEAGGRGLFCGTSQKSLASSVGSSSDVDAVECSLMATTKDGKRGLSPLAAPMLGVSPPHTPRRKGSEGGVSPRGTRRHSVISPRTCFLNDTATALSLSDGGNATPGSNPLLVMPHASLSLDDSCGNNPPLRQRRSAVVEVNSPVLSAAGNPTRLELGASGNSQSSAKLVVGGAAAKVLFAGGTGGSTPQFKPVEGLQFSDPGTPKTSATETNNMDETDIADSSSEGASGAFVFGDASCEDLLEAQSAEAASPQKADGGKAEAAAAKHRDPTAVPTGGKEASGDSFVPRPPADDEAPGANTAGEARTPSPFHKRLPALPPTTALTISPPTPRGQDCTPTTIADALAIITKQKIEIDGLKKNNRDLEDDSEKLIAQCARLMGKMAHEVDCERTPPMSPRMPNDAATNKLRDKLKEKETEIHDLRGMVDVLKKGRPTTAPPDARTADEVKIVEERYSRAERLAADAEQRRSDAQQSFESWEAKTKTTRKQFDKLTAEVASVERSLKQLKNKKRQEEDQVNTTAVGEITAEVEAQYKRTTQRLTAELTELKCHQAWAEAALDRLGISPPASWFEPDGTLEPPPQELLASAACRLKHLKPIDADSFNSKPNRQTQRSA
ncbi:hypothetical protein DIPPA_02776 [Diplonema papillatum]|nr:hypothetical protein DIPPA_02776 [Diplonema papillatum]